MMKNAVAVVAWSSDRLDIFALGTDNQMYHKAWDGSAWYPSPTDWDGMGGTFNSAPAVAAWGANRLDIFALGTDNQMYHKAWDGSSWLPSPDGWDALGGAFNSAPAVAAWGANRLDIFALGTDNQMFHKAWDGSAWYPSPTDWDGMGGTFNSAPAVAAWSANRLDIFALGTDNQMYHKAWDGSAWLPSPDGWDGLGGAFSVPLMFIMQQQQQSNWCWAAVSASVSQFYEQNSAWTQCAVANTQLGRSDCCGTGASGPCNVYGYLDKGLQEVGHLDHWQGGTTPFATLSNEIMAARPLGIRVAWSGGGAHFIAAVGADNSDLVLVADPGSGSRAIVDYTTLETSYEGSGTWTDSFFTKA
jgi:hypothetical protein